MKLEELNYFILSKSFKSTGCGQVYKFVSDHLLQVNTGDSFEYSIKEQSQSLVLEHNNFFGKEPLLVMIDTLKYPITLSLVKMFSLELFTTFIEE